MLTFIRITRPGDRGCNIFRLTGQALPEGHHGAKKKSVKCWNIMFAQDQDTQNPIYHLVYLRHQNPFEILPVFINKVRPIVGGAP